MYEREMDYIVNAGKDCRIKQFDDDHKPNGRSLRSIMKTAKLIYESGDFIHLAIELTSTQRAGLEELWFVYGNHGRKHSRAGHRFVQCFLENGEDRRDFFKPSHELCQAVDVVMEKK